MKQVKFGQEAREAILSGINECSKAVASTLGLKGRYAIIGGDKGTFRATKDGVSVAQSVSFYELPKNTGAMMVRQAASSTVEMAGDGTTTTSILLNDMCNLANEEIKNGASPVMLKKGMELATEKIVEEIKKIAIPIKDENGNVNHELAREVAMIASNSDEEIGGIVAQSIKAVGAEGIVDVQSSNTSETTLEKTEGVLVDSGWHNQYFVTDPSRMRAVLDNPYILLYDRVIDKIKPLMGVLESVTREGRSILIICEDLKDEALSTLVANKMKGALNICVVKCPAFGVQKRLILEDLAIVTGATFMSEEKGLKLDKTNVSHLGKAEKIVVEKGRTFIIKGAGDIALIEERVKALSTQIENEENEEDKMLLKGRLAKMNGGVALIRVGGVTPQEIEEKKDRVEDSLCASRSAIEEGIVAGGGSAYLKLMSKLDSIECSGDVKKGVEVIKTALKSPFVKLLENAGVVPNMALNEIANSEINIGYNLKTDKVEDLRKAGVIDSAKVVRCALENANSIAGIFVCTETTIFMKQ